MHATVARSCCLYSTDKMEQLLSVSIHSRLDTLDNQVTDITVDSVAPLKWERIVKTHKHSCTDTHTYGHTEHVCTAPTAKVTHCTHHTQAPVLHSKGKGGGRL